MKCKKIFGALMLAMSLTIAVDSHAAIRINELFISPEDGVPDDEGDGREFFELISDNPNESLAGVWLLEIIGLDFDRGVVAQALDVGSVAASTGSNGLFLWRDSPVELLPLRDPATAYHFADFPGGDGLGESDNVSYFLVRNFTGSVGDDLDTIGGPEDLDGPFTDDGNGIFDITPWDEILDAVGYVEAGEPGISYAGAYGGVDLVTPFGPDAFVRLPGTNQWFAFDAPDGEEDPSFVGPFFADGFDSNDNYLMGVGQLPANIASQFMLTPGNHNPSIVPEPSTALLSLLCLFGASICRRNR